MNSKRLTREPFRKSGHKPPVMGYDNMWLWMSILLPSQLLGSLGEPSTIGHGNRAIRLIAILMGKQCSSSLGEEAKDGETICASLPALINKSLTLTLAPRV